MSFARCALGLLVAMTMTSPVAFGNEILGSLREAAKTEIETAETDALFKEVELSKKYLAALAALETKLAAEGNLEAIVHLRQEREAVEKGQPSTTYPDKPLAELRDKYGVALKAIRDELAAARAKTVAAVTPKIREQESLLTKAGKVAEAVALRQEGERMVQELATGIAPPIPEETSPAVSPALLPLKAIDLPTDKPPLVEKPFSIKGRWLESLTTPAGRQRISEPIIMGDRGKKAWISVVIPPGSHWTGSKGQYIELSAGKVLASKSRFEEIFMAPDLACNFYFLNCAFDGCGFGKGGVWYGWDHAGKFYFENCIISKRFGKDMNIVDTGYRVQTSVFENIEFTPFRFRKKEPADYVNQPWLRIVNSRFVDCQVPVSVLLLTRDCIFENCTFVNDLEDANQEPFNKAIETVIYTRGCKSRITKMHEKVTLTERPDTELKGGVVPTAASLAIGIGL